MEGPLLRNKLLEEADIRAMWKKGSFKSSGTVHCDRIGASGFTLALILYSVTNLRTSQSNSISNNVARTIMLMFNDLYV